MRLALFGAFVALVLSAVFAQAQSIFAGVGAEVGIRPAYGSSAPGYYGPAPRSYGAVYGGRHDRRYGSTTSRRGPPQCGDRGTYSPKLGKCVGKEFHDIAVAEGTFSGCREIKTRMVMKDGRWTQQQRGIDCRR